MLDPILPKTPVLSGDPQGYTFAPFWFKWLSRLAQTVNGLSGGATVVTAIANVPNAASVPAGTEYFVGSPFFHLVVSDGTVWRFAGDQPGFWEGPFDPGTNGYHALDGTAVTYLVANAATLSTATVTLPNEDASPGTYHKTGAYDHLVNAAVNTGSSATGITAATANPVLQFAKEGTDFWCYQVAADANIIISDPHHSHAPGEPLNVKIIRKFRR